MFSYIFKHFNKECSDRAIVLGTTATVLLYLLLVLIAEPLRGMAAMPVGTVV